MLKAYQLKNFKAFAETPLIPIRPLTLIYGQNSSGKSSILQSLLLLKQTIDESDDPSTPLVPKGNLVDLGGFREFLHKHLKDEAFSVGLTLSAPDFYPFTRIRDNERPDLTVRFSFKSDTPREDVTITHAQVSLGGQRALVSYDGERRAVTRANTTTEGQWPRSFLQPDANFSTILRTTDLDIDHALFATSWRDFRASVEKQVPSLRELLDAYKRSAATYRGILKNRQAAHEPEEQTKTIKDQLSQSELGAESLDKYLKQLDEYNFETAKVEVVTESRRLELTCRTFLPVARLADDEYQSPYDFNVAATRRLEFGKQAAFELGQLTVAAGSALRFMLDSIVYLGPLREYPERYHVYSGTAGVYVGKTGKRVYDILFKRPDLTLKRE